MRSRAIEEYKQRLAFTDQQREALVGLLLGDGCLETQNRGRTYRLKIEQSADHELYVRHIHELFQEWFLSPPRKRLATAANGTVTESWVCQTVSHSAFRFYAQQFYVERVKIVPELIHHWLSVRGLAYWFMDDGSRKSHQSYGCFLNTQGFARRDVQRLGEVLTLKFGLQTSLRKHREQYQIYVSGKSSETFLSLIDPHIVDSMRYKLPRKRRTHLPKR